MDQDRYGPPLSSNVTEILRLESAITELKRIHENLDWEDLPSIDED